MSAQTLYAMNLKEEFIEWLEGDEDVAELLMDKIGDFMEQKATILNEDSKYDIGLQILANVGVR